MIEDKLTSAIQNKGKCNKEVYTSIQVYECLRQLGATKSWHNEALKCWKMNVENRLGGPIKALY